MSSMLVPWQRGGGRLPFLSLASAWFAVALPAIALMYILKKNYVNTEIASHLLWRRLLMEQEANSPWQRLRSRLLLFLQLLAALLLVLALMEPVIFRSASSKGHVVVVIDRSGSMTALSRDTNAEHEAEMTRFEHAIDAAAAWIDGKSQNQPVTIIATGPEPIMLMAKESDKAKLKQALIGLRPYYGHSDNAASLSLADSLHEGDDVGYTLLFSDGKWVDAEEANALALRFPVNVMSTDSKADLNNGAIQSFGVRSDPAQPEKSQIIVTVRNDAAQERSYKVDVYASKGEGGSERVAELMLSVPPGEWRSAEAAGLASAYYKAVLGPVNDDFITDNVAFGFPTTQRDRKVLLVTTGNMFLEKALALAGTQPVQLSPESAAPKKEEAADIDWIVLDGVAHTLQMDKSWMELLSSKPLWIIDHPVEGAANAVMPKHASVQAKEHAVTAYVTLQDTHIGRFYKPDYDEVSWGESILTYGDIPAIYAGRVNGLPRLRFTFKLQDSDLPLRPEFPVLIVQSAEWMNGGALGELGLATAGESLELPLQAETVKAEWEAIDGFAASAQELDQQRIAPITLTGGNRHEAPLLPGLYRLLERNANDQLIAGRYLAVTANSSELANAATGGTTLALQAAGSSEEIGGESGDSAQSPSHPTQIISLQLWAAVFILIVMLVEWEVYRRGHRG